MSESLNPPRPKLLIVANGLRDHVGHYFETSLSLAEAALRADLHPVLGAHVDCSAGLLPAWLESHRIFRTDHWMRPAPDAASWLSPSGDPPESGLRGAETAPAEHDAPLTAAARQTAGDLARLARLASRYALPPLAYDAAHTVAYCCVPRGVRRPHRQRLRSGAVKVARRWRYGGDAAVVEQSQVWPEITAGIDDVRCRSRTLDAARRLAPLGMLPELEYGLMFRQDLERFLAASGAGPHDQVLLTTAHAREALAVYLLAERLGPDRSPIFHLEFRHPLFDGEAADEERRPSPGVAMQRALLSLHVDWGASDRIKFYTDAEALARDYESISGLRFGVLPLPFRSELIETPAQSDMGAAPLTVAYLGEARDEKGFHWLPDLLEALDEPYLRFGRVRLLIQANVSCPEHNPRSVTAMERLKARAGAGVELAALTDALSPTEYYRLVSRAEVVLLPYLASRYRACTSGILAEALAAGAAVVVPRRTWLESQLPPGGGEAFDDFESFVAAVKRVIDGHGAYRAAVRAHRPAWLARHTPDALVRALLPSAGRAA